MFGDLYTQRINTGQGLTEVYLMNQNVKNDSSVTFANVTSNLTGNADSATSFNGLNFNGLSTRFTGDLNTLGLSTTSGIYNIGSGYTNGPAGSLYGTLFAIWNSDISTQFWFSYNGDAYWRKSSGGSYSGSTWRTLLDSSNSPEALVMDQNVRTTDSPTFDGLTIGDSGNTGTTLNIIATNTAGSPAATAMINMSGYEGRAIGTMFTDVTYSGREWFAGLRYSGGFANYQIGYDLTGGQAEYAANSMLTINDSGNAFFKGYVSATSFRPTNIVTNRIVKFDGTDLDDSIMSDDGSTVTLSGDLDVTGTIDGNVSGTANDANRLVREDNRVISPSELTAGRLKFGFTSYSNNNSGPWADFLHLRSYTDSSGGSDNLVMFKKSGIGMRIWQQTWGSSTAYSSYVDVLDSSNSPYAYRMNQDVRTSDNVTFNKLRVTSAGNTAGGSILMGASGEGTTKWSFLAGTHYNATSQAKGIAIIGGLGTSTYNKVFIGGGPYEINPATQIEFWTHTAITNSTGGSKRMTINSGGNVIAEVDFRAPIFYDSPDTSYHLNPAGTSNLYRVDINNQLRMNSGTAIYLYTAAGNQRGMIQATDTNDNHLIIATSGGEDISFKDGGLGGTTNFLIRGDGDTITTRNNYATRFYSSGQSTYYVDPDGTTNINNLTVNGTISGITASEIGATPLDHIRSLGTQAFTNGSNPNITTAQVISEMEFDGAFDSYSSVFKTSWSYAGNYNLTDAGRFTETAGSSWITWTDNSSDSARGNITALAIAPNSGGSAGKVFIYNDQGSSYSPGWREVWTSTSDGAGSGLDADLWDGNQFASYLNQAVRTNDRPTFLGLTISDNIYHTGDTNTYMGFHTNDQWRVVTAGGERLEVNNNGIPVQGSRLS